MGRTPCCDKANVKKGPWSPEEDAKLKDYIQKHGTGGNWISLPLKAGLKRCGKSCRLRWLNYLRPDIKHGGFSEEEDRIICNLYSTIGSRWSVIAAQLPGRTDNDIKNYWNTKLKKKLMEINKNTIRRTSQKTSSTIINSSASSSISSPSSYSDHHSNQLVMSSSSSSFNGPFSTPLLDPISFSPNLLLNPTINNTNNNHATLFHHQLISQDQISFTMISTPPVMVGSAQNNYHDVKENDHNHSLLGFGGRDQGSCSSSDDAEYGGGVIVEEEEIKRIKSMSFVNGWNNERQLEEQEMWMDYGLEEIKQLISSSTSCSSNAFFL